MSTVRGEQSETVPLKTTKFICILLFAGILSIIHADPSYSQFTKLPKSTKLIDFGVAGNGISQTLSLTTVFPINKIDGWVGFYGSRVSGQEGVISETFKFHIEREEKVKKVDIEMFGHFEHNVTAGTALTAQVGGTIEPSNYKKDSFSVSTEIGYFLETIQPFENLAFKDFDPTSFRWIVSSTVDWRKLNAEVTFTPEIGFKDYRLCVEPTLTVDLSEQFGLRFSGTINYNSAPLTENLEYNYLSILRITL